MQQDFNVSYVGKPSQRLSLFSELKFKLDGNTSEYTGGAKLKFKDAAITGYMTSKMKAHGTYEKQIE